MFSDENELVKILENILLNMGFNLKEKVNFGSLEIDLIGLSNLKPDLKSRNKTAFLYAFEAKIATTNSLRINLIEQSITRLLFADYVYMVVPERASVWVNEFEKREINIPNLLIKLSNGTYSSKIGIIAIKNNSNDNLKIYRVAKKSGITQKPLKDLTLRLFKKDK